MPKIEKPKQKKPPAIFFHAPEELRARLKIYCAKEQKTVGDTMNEMLSLYLNYMEAKQNERHSTKSNETLITPE
jgi:hypothetical protein